MQEMSLDPNSKNAVYSERTSDKNTVIKVFSHLFVGPLSHAHHEEEEAGEADSLHGRDEEKGVSLRVVRSHRYLQQLRQRVRAQAAHVQTLSQAEGEGEQRQGGGHEPPEHQVTQALLHHLHLQSTETGGDRSETGRLQSSNRNGVREAEGCKIPLNIWAA